MKAATKANIMPVRQWGTRLLLLISLMALGYELWTTANAIIVPLFQNTRGYYLCDYQYFYEGAVRWLHSATTLYDGNTSDGFLLLRSGEMINYGYPPPAVLLYAPLAWLPLASSFLAWWVINLALALLLGLFLVRWLAQTENWQGNRMATASFICFFIASGPIYSTLMFGQVNVVILWLCVLYVLFVKKQRYGIAALLVALGFWIKFYPIYLLLFALLEKRPWRLILFSVGALVLLPVLLMPVLPSSLYVHYFSAIFPQLAEQTVLHIYNQALMPVLMRAGVSSELWLSWTPVFIPQWAGLINVAVMGLLFLWAFHGYWRKREYPLQAYAVLVGVIPMTNTYGWGGTYALALPAIMFAMGCFRTFPSRFAQVLVLVLAGVFLLPAYHELGGAFSQFKLISWAIYARYLVAAAFCLSLALSVRSKSVEPLVGRPQQV